MIELCYEYLSVRLTVCYYHVTNLHSIVTCVATEKTDNKTLYFYGFLKSTLISNGTTMGRDKLHID